jgi:hypothetical protein
LLASALFSCTHFSVPDPKARKFLGLPDPDPLVKGTDPDSAKDPDPRPPIIKKNCLKALISTVLRLLYGFFSVKNDVNVP